jgi:hypothetical protein
MQMVVLCFGQRALGGEIMPDLGGKRRIGAG